MYFSTDSGERSKPCLGNLHHTPVWFSVQGRKERDSFIPYCWVALSYPHILHLILNGLPMLPKETWHIFINTAHKKAKVHGVDFRELQCGCFACYCLCVGVPFQSNSYAFYTIAKCIQGCLLPTASLLQCSKIIIFHHNLQITPSRSLVPKMRHACRVWPASFLSTSEAVQCFGTERKVSDHQWGGLRG